MDTSALGATAFLSSRPAEVPVDLALFANPAYQHTAFEVRSLEDLRALHQRVLGRGVQVDGSDRQRRKGKDVSTEVASAEPNSASSRALAGASAVKFGAGTGTEEPRAPIRSSSPLRGLAEPTPHQRRPLSRRSRE